MVITPVGKEVKTKTMAETIMIERPRVHWSAAVAGAFLAAATATVLGLFGAAFGKAGIGVLSGVWQILTPLVAGFVGAVVAAALASRAAYLNGILVWALWVAFAGTVMALASRPLGTGAAQGVSAGPSGTTLALSGLAAILGLVGALVGSAIGASLDGRLIRRAQERPLGSREYARAATSEAVKPASRTSSEPPELRH